MRGKTQRRSCEAERDGERFIEMGHTSVNTPIEAMGYRKPRKSETSSDSSMEGETLDTYETPPSSVCKEEFIDPAILPVVAVAAPEFTGICDTSEPKGSGAGTIQSAYGH
jgi:hypothetical protein